MLNDPPTLFDELPPDPKHLARATDPETSKKGARSIAMRAGTQLADLLAVYARDTVAGRGELTDDEAADRAGLLSRPGCCWWHRCSDLRDRGLIEAVGSRRSTYTGEERMTCRITDLGWSVANDLKWKEVKR